jgi:hypothetical protein
MRDPVSSPERTGITEGIQDVVRNLGGVVQNEMRLAKAEASAGMKEVAGGLATLGAGLAFIIPALTLLGMAVVSLLTSQTELAPWIASAITGFAFAIVGVILVQLGRRGAASSHIGMSTTADNMKQDIQALKESVQ